MTRYAKTMSQTLAEMKMNDPKLIKIFDKLKKGSKIKIKHDSVLEKGTGYISYTVTAKNIVGKGKRFEQEKINKAIEESRQRQALQAKERERKANMSLIERLREESLSQTPADIINNQLKYHGRVGTN